MVDCQHLSKSVCISAAKVASLDIRRDVVVENRLELPHNPNRDVFEHKGFCTVCGTCPSSWMCLHCGSTFCSRYHKGHAMVHHHETGHCVAIDCHEFQIFCYECDDEVQADYNDTKLLPIVKALRKLFVGQEDGEIQYMDQDVREHELETEEENDYRGRVHHEKSFLLDEDSGSVPEEELNPTRNAKRQTKNFFPSEFTSGPLHPPVRSRRRKERKSRNSRQKNASFDDEPVGVGRSFRRRRGLKNLGNTCFMNAVIQALNSTSIFRDYLLQLPIIDPDDNSLESPVEAPRYVTRQTVSNLKDSKSKPHQIPFSLAEEMRKVLQSLNQANKDTAVAPHEFYTAVCYVRPAFRGFMQHDAHEFLRVTLERMHTELRRCRIPETLEQWLTDATGPAPVMPSGSAVSRIFEGALQSQVICLTCRAPSIKLDPFMDVSLDLNQQQQRGGVGGCGAGGTRLMDCLRSFFAKEVLDQREQYMCGHCGSKQPSTKQLSIKVLPNVLCLHLKRFRANGSKNDPVVEFPASGLDIKDFMSPSNDVRGSTVYDLTAVIVHVGKSSSGGHYLAYGQQDGYWYQFNDQTVQMYSEQAVLHLKAYVLFYTRRASPSLSSTPSSAGSSPLYVSGSGALEPSGAY